MEQQKQRAAVGLDFLADLSPEHATAVRLYVAHLENQERNLRLREQKIGLLEDSVSDKQTEINQLRALNFEQKQTLRDQVAHIQRLQFDAEQVLLHGWHTDSGRWVPKEATLDNLKLAIDADFNESAKEMAARTVEQAANALASGLSTPAMGLLQSYATELRAPAKD